MVVFALAETEERRFVRRLVECILADSFGDSFFLESLFWGNQKDMVGLVTAIGPASINGDRFVLHGGPDAVLERIDRFGLSQLPCLEDTLQVALGVSYHRHGRLPEWSDPHSAPQFEPRFRSILFDLGLVSADGVPDTKFYPFLISAWLLGPCKGTLFEGDANWHPDVARVLESLCDRTWNNAPEDFRNRLRSNDEHHARRARGMLGTMWRYGYWLSEAELDRTIDLTHLPLAETVYARLRAEVGLGRRE